MDERDKHYLRNYWKEAGRRAYQDARHFEPHVWWEIARVVAVLMIALALSVAAATVWGHVRAGLLVLALETALILLWYLFILTPARMHRDALLRVREAEDKIFGLEVELALRPKPEPPPPAAIEPTVTSDTLNRLREVYVPFRNAMASAHQLVDQFSQLWHSGSIDDWRPLLSKLLQRYVLRDSENALERLGGKIAATSDLAMSKFDDLKHDFHAAIDEYRKLGENLVPAGCLFFEARFNLLSRSLYSQLYQKHQKFVEKLREIRLDSDFGELAGHLDKLERLLPEPVTAPPPGVPPSTKVSG
ncbi:MAG TPA: hypothetical protein VMW75_28440 [Thermoanaerobaculia bacterium]|nr:hypothetical protein [Thermoanaerobaculia bacterium]